eukprot:scaffold9526_cov247-Amphora_coffeaeformis.AAC.2
MKAPDVFENREQYFIITAKEIGRWFQTSSSAVPALLVEALVSNGIITARKIEWWGHMSSWDVQDPLDMA